MTKVVVHNVSVFDRDQVRGPLNVLFAGSPGNVLSTLADQADGEMADVLIDGAGCTLIPGMIDVNVDAKAVPGVLEKFASRGVTTVIDMSSSSEEIHSLRATVAGKTHHAAYLVTGKVGAAPGSCHGEFYSLQEEDAIRSPHDAASFVETRITGAEQADYIKAIADLPGFDEATLKAIADAGRRHGKLTAAHASQCAAFSRALRAGFDVIEHIPLDGDLDDELVKEAAARGTVVVPSLSLLQGILRLRSAGAQPGDHGLPSSSGRPRAGAATHELPKAGDSRGSETIFAQAFANVKKLRDAGVIICAGSGANPIPGLEMSFGDSLHSEVELLARAGLTNMEALRAATCVAASAFKLDDRGAVRSGLRADLVLLDGNPAEDITAIRRIKKA